MNKLPLSIDYSEDHLIRMDELRKIHGSKNRDDIDLAKSIISNNPLLDFRFYDTIKVLEFCIPYYEYVGINVNTPIPYWKEDSSWINNSIFGQPFGILTEQDWKNREKYNSGCIIETWGKETRRTWPAIWGAVNQVGISSCGNSHQYQIGRDKLVKGLYQNINGEWYGIDPSTITGSY